MLAENGVIRRVKFKTGRVVIRRLRRAGISWEIINSLSTLGEGRGHTRRSSEMKILENMTVFLFSIRPLCNFS